MIKNMQYLCKAVQNYNPWLRKVQMLGNSSFRLFGTVQNKIFLSPATSRLNLDFYKSRNFEYSFLEMPTDPSNVEYVHQALKELKLYYDSNGEIVKKINDTYLDIQEYLNANRNDVNNVLKFNNKYAELVKKVKGNPILGEKAVIYSHTIQMIERLLSDDVLNENASYNILSPISQLLLNLGIIDLSLWKKVIHSTFLFPEKFTSSADLKRTIMCIVTFLKRFNFSENNETGFTRYHFFFKESELPSILTRHMISRFFAKFETHFLYNPEYIRANINDICTMINMVCDIIAKLIRISFVNHFEERKFLKKFESILIANLKYIAPHHCLDICTSYLNMGFHNNVLLKEFLDYFQNNISSIDADRVLISIVRAWKAEGKYDEGIYSGFVKNSLKNFIQNPKHLLKLPGLAYDLIIFQLKDEEIWYLLLDTICCIPFNELRFFQKKSLHLLFQNLKDQSNIVIDLSRYLELINYLSKFCIGTNLKYDFTELTIPEIEDKGFVNCCDKHTIERYRKTFKEKMLAHPELYKKSLSFNEQIHAPNFHENFIRKAVEQYFPKFLQAPIKITHELPVCSYKVDIALEIPDVYDKIAIEISGLAYTFETGAFIGKKKLKFEFLRKNSWIPIQVNLGTNMSHNLMAIASDFNDEKIAKTVYELLRQEIKTQLGKDLPALKNSKWMTSKSQDQSDTRVKTSI